MREGGGAGNDVGPTCQWQQPAVPFQFPFIVLLHGQGAFFNLQPLSPSSTSILVANFIPRRQLQPSSSSSSTFVAFQFPNPVAFLFPPPLLDARGVLEAAAAI
jgi:hypothetical protein